MGMMHIKSLQGTSTKRLGAIVAAVILLSSLVILTQDHTMAQATKDQKGKQGHQKLKIGVLIYTHGDMMNEHGTPSMNKLMAIEKMIEKKFKQPAEIVFHMPYNWDEGLMALDEMDVDYAIFLYTDLFGPNSTVIHNVTRGVFGGIEAYDFCPGVPMGDACMYMGMVTEPASTVSDTTIVFAEPARPDHTILKDIFLKQAKEVSKHAKKEILVLVGHGARSDTNDMFQVKELSKAARYVEKELRFADSTAVTAREDWPDLQPAAIEKAVNEIKQMLEDTNAKRVVLVPATGSGSGFHAIEMALQEEGIKYKVAPEGLPLGEKQFVKWAEEVIDNTINFIKKKKPTESTIGPGWSKKH